MWNSLLTQMHTRKRPIGLVRDLLMMLKRPPRHPSSRACFCVNDTSGISFPSSLPTLALPPVAHPRSQHSRCFFHQWFMAFLAAAFVGAAPAGLFVRTARAARCCGRSAAGRWAGAQVVIANRSGVAARWRAVADGNGEAPAAVAKDGEPEVRVLGATAVPSIVYLGSLCIGLRCTVLPQPVV